MHGAIRSARIVLTIEQGMAIRSVEGITDGSGGSEPSVLDVTRGEIHVKEANR
jgi:hypothetical protein